MPSQIVEIEALNRPGVLRLRKETARLRVEPIGDLTELMHGRSNRGHSKLPGRFCAISPGLASDREGDCVCPVHKTGRWQSRRLPMGSADDHRAEGAFLRWE